MNRYSNTKKAFTLLELLVVIGIIAVLAGMLLGALHKVKKYTKKVEAREMMYEVRVAFKQYLVDYRKFPDMDATVTDPDVLDVLAGKTHNSLGHKYMDVTTNEAVVGLLDPWNNLYRVCIDNGRGGDGSAYDHKVMAGPYGEIESDVVLWSAGKDGIDAGAGQKDDVRSWD